MGLAMLFASPARRGIESAAAAAWRQRWSRTLRWRSGWALGVGALRRLVYKIDCSLVCGWEHGRVAAETGAAVAVSSHVAFYVRG